MLSVEESSQTIGLTLLDVCRGLLKENSTHMEVVILEVTKNEYYESVFVKWCLGPLFLYKLIEIIGLVLLNRVSVDKHSADLRGDQSA